jgi:hypothetical protein
MIESSSWLSSILGLSTVSFSSIEMEATEIKMAVTMLPSIPWLFAVFSMEMEATEIKKGCYNNRVVLLAVLHPRAFHCLLLLDRNGGH